MKPIAEVVEALGEIPKALVALDSDPFRSPVAPYPVSEITQQPTVVLDLPDDWDYPDWVEEERWRPIDQRVRGERTDGDAGVDALAWFVSFHYVPNRAWGIFIPLSSLAYFEKRVFADVKADRAFKWRVAFAALLAHEQMHFGVDYFCAQWELLLRTPSWAALRDARRIASVPYLAVEEQLANGYMLQQAGAAKRRDTREALRKFVASQPTGYRDGLSAAEPESFDRVATEVMKHYVGIHSIERGLNICADPYELTRGLPNGAELFNCPIHVIHDERSVGLPEDMVRFITCLPRIEETEQFSRRLKQLDHSLQGRWAKLKLQLHDGVPRSARLEKMKSAEKDVFSVRLNDNFRVHLRMRERDTWQAVDVGSHKEMGHG